MKKLVIIALLVFGFSFSTFAQPAKGDFEFGFGLGYNFSTVSTSSGSTDTGSGINITGSANYFFSNRWSIKGKLVYDQKGWDNGFVDYSQVSSDPNAYYITDFNLNYLTVPVTVNWNFGKKRNWYLNLGPYAGFLLNANETNGNENVTSSFNSADFGIAWGIGVKIPVSDQFKIYLEYDEQDGFTDIFKVSETAAVLNSRGSFNVGVNFLLK
jgi:opacity protein-like surface antigen